MEKEIGVVLDDRYQLRKVIGTGGSSIVYLAWDLKLHTFWAVKKIKDGHIKDIQSSQRLKTGITMELYVLSHVSFPAFPRIVNIIEDTYIIMDYMEGKTLDVFVKSNKVDTKQGIEWGIQICDMMCHLHGQIPPIIYRDLKPCNLIVSPNLTLALVDFGNAKILVDEQSKDTMALGTVGYAAPEQYGDGMGRGMESTDERTDVYGLGATLSQLFSPDCPRDIKDILDKCMNYDRSKRYQYIGEVRDDLLYLDEAGNTNKKSRTKSNKINRKLNKKTNNKTNNTTNKETNKRIYKMKSKKNGFIPLFVFGILIAIFSFFLTSVVLRVILSTIE